ncbi:MAG: adenylate/guanylate cyclase domain-containing protein, partial [Alsobacter sp.]
FAQDGVDALEIIAQSPDLDLVITDINMPRMDGLTLLSRLQDREDRLSTIIVSAYGDMANIRTAMNRGAFDFLTKPIDFGDFEATMHKTLRHVGDLRAARRRFAEAERAQAALARYFSPNLASELAAADGSAPFLRGARRELTVMFTDIAGFTGLVEQLDPQVLSRLLNDYFGHVTDIVFQHGGTVAKVMGDALHVLFGAPQDQPDHAERALRCALAIDDYCEALRTRWAQEGVPLGRTRIGLHAGAALVGNFGHDRFFDYTAYGDTINVAARLEAANKALGTRICASGAVVERAPDVAVRPIGNLMLRGRQEKLACFEPMADGSQETGQSERYMSAFRQLEAGDAEAVGALASLVAASATDALASFHLRRLLNGETGATVVIP